MPLILFFLIILLAHPSIPARRFNPADSQTKSTNMAGQIPTVEFCELVKNPRLYFGKTVRLTATFEQAIEGQYLLDAECEPQERLGINYETGGDSRADYFNNHIEKIRSRYEGIATVTVVGTLRDAARHDFVSYQHRFDIARFENISEAIFHYDGNVEKGRLYRAEVACKGDDDLWPIIPPRLPMHYAWRFEWTNLKKFPELKKATGGACRKRIVFRVLSQRSMRMTDERWNMTITCEIVRVERDATSRS